MDLPLAPTLSALDGPPRAAMERVRALGFRYVQLSASAPGLRPRELDRSARRDLLATLRRKELIPAGLDLWIPPTHLVDPTHSPRAMDTLLATVRLAADLERCPVSITLPDEIDDAMIETLAGEADRCGVTVADHRLDGPASPLAAGVDPAAWLADGRDPAEGVLAMKPPPATARLVDLLTSGTRGAVGDPQAGRLDVQAYRVALSVSGYDRPVVLDTRQWVGVEEGMTRSKEVWEGEST